MGKIMKLTKILAPGLALGAILVAGCGEQGNDPIGAPVAGGAPTETIPAGAGLDLVYSPISDGRVSVALRAARPGRDPIAAVQGRLAFDPAALEFEGQEAQDGVLAFANPARAAEGELRLAAIAADGFSERVATFVFRVRRADFARGLRFRTEEAATRGLKLVRLPEVRVAQASDLSVPRSSAPISFADWVARLEPGRDPRVLSFNGQVVQDLRFGNVDLSGTTAGPAGQQITSTDALIVLQVSTGARDIVTDETAGTVERDLAIAGNVVPFTSGSLERVGVNADGTRNLSSSDALLILQGSVAPGNLIAGTPIGQVIPGRAAAAGTVTVSSDITTNTTWTRSNTYELQGVIRVRNGATLTIEPGTVVQGVTSAALFVERDGRIIADGNPYAPIRFTCTAAEGSKTKGCWRGLWVAGNAPVTEPSPNTGAADGNCQDIPGRQVAGACNEDIGEGNGPVYGGTNPADSSGVLRYIIVEYGGWPDPNTANSELNNLTLGGVGNRTVLSNIQVHAGRDDGFEVFGGTFDVKNLITTANQDDALDWTQGWTGRVQYWLHVADPVDSDNGIEGDHAQRSANRGNFTNGRTNPVVYNFTMIGQPDPASNTAAAAENKRQGFHLRRGSAGQLFNGIVYNMRVAGDVDDTANNTCDGLGTATGINIRHVIFSGNQALGLFTGDLGSGTEPTACGSYTGSTTVGDFLLSFLADGAFSNQINPAGFAFNGNRQFDRGNLPDYRIASSFGGATTGATPPAGFFDPVNFIGAVSPAAGVAPFFEGWARSWQSPTTP